jgi:hypothetical protein
MALIGSFGIFGSVLAIRDDASGYKYLLGAGAVGIVGTFIPIGIYLYPFFYPSYPQILWRKL